MKKFILLLTMLLTLASTSLCFAADGGDLNKEQRSIERIVDAFDGEPIPAYSVISPLLTADLAKNMGEKGYADLQKAVKSQFGNLKEVKFLSFERFDQGDRIVYLGSFSRENVVVMVFGFDKAGKIAEFNFAPYQAPAQEQAPAAN